MRLSAKIGLYTVVLAGVVGGTSAWAVTDKAVAISIDGQVRTVHTRAGTVGAVLKQTHLAVDPHDAIAPPVSSSVHDGSKVVLRRGRELHLMVDGHGRDVWTTALTVNDALSELGYGTGKTVSVSRSQRLALTPTQITLLTPKHVSIRADGKTTALLTTVPTVAAALTAAHVVLGAEDKISAAPPTAITNGEVVTIQRVRTATTTATVTIPFTKTTEQDATRLIGTTIVVQNGRDGSYARTVQFIYVDGKLAGKRLIKKVVTKKPVDQITKVGTKPKPVPQPKIEVQQPSQSDTNSSGSTTRHSSAPRPAPTQPAPTPTQSSSPVPVSSGGSPKAIAARMVADHGWSSSDYTCLVKLWNRESSWNVHAYNGDGGAYGIPQSLPGSKMASAGPNWRDDAATQIRWGLGYISGRYGNPCGAWSHSEQFNWY